MKGKKKPGDSCEIVGLEDRRSGGGDCPALWQGGPVRKATNDDAAVKSLFAG
jgi:hypothetical protein